MAITYHCMEYNQRLKDDLLGEVNRPGSSSYSAEQSQ